MAAKDDDCPPASPYDDPAIAAVYARVSAPLQFDAPARDLVEMLKLSPGAIALDVGTGTGAVARAAVARVGPDGLVIGVDASLEMLRWSRGTRRYAVASAEIPRLPFREATFAAVTAGFVVSHVQDFRAGLTELRRVCRVGGRIAMSAWGSLSNPVSRLWGDTAATFVPRDALDQAFRAHIPWDEYFSRLSNVRGALEDAGLRSVAETRHYEVRMRSGDFLLSREASIQGMLLRERLSVHDWQAFRRRVADAFQHEFGDTVTYVRDVHFGVGTKVNESSESRTG